MRLIDFKSLVGNASTKNIVTKCILDGGLPKIIACVGESGTGKSSMAEIIALRLTCESPNREEPCCTCNSCIEGIKLIREGYKARRIKKINMTSISNSQDIKEMIKEIFKRETSESMVFILEEVHSLSTQNQTAILEELDRMPNNVTTIFCTTRFNNLLEELKNRIKLILRFKTLSTRECKLLISNFCLLNKIKISEHLENVIIRNSKNVPRRIINSLELIQSNHSLTEKELLDYFEDLNTDDLRMLLKSFTNISDGLKLLNEILERVSPFDFIKYLKSYLIDLTYLSKDLSFKETNLSSSDKQFATFVGFSNLMKLYNKLNKLQINLTKSDVEYLIIELLLYLRKELKESKPEEPIEIVSPQESFNRGVEVNTEMKKSQKFNMLNEDILRSTINASICKGKD